MKLQRFILILAALGLVVLMNSCSKMPQKELDAAREAIETARTAEADQYLPQDFRTLQDSLNTAVALMEKQNGRFFLLRNYDKTKEKLAAVMVNAEKASDNAAARKESIIQELQQSMADVNAAIKQAHQLLAKAPTGKEGRVALMSMKSELTAVEGSLNEIPDLMGRGTYLAALDKVTAAKQKVEAINSELSQAIAKRAAIQKKGRM